MLFLMDYIQRMIKGSGEMLAKVLTGKEGGKEFVIYSEILEAEHLAPYINALISEGKICEAEDILFKQLQLNNTQQIYNIGVAMYDRLDTLTEEYLLAGNFSRAEIARGREDLNKYDKII